jgi:uncharacterized protein (TIGR00369 family)
MRGAFNLAGSKIVAGAPHITVDEFNALMRAEIPVSSFLGITALEIGAGTAVLRLPFTPAALRPGGVQNGPALMALADLSMYAAVMSLCGNEPGVVSSDLAMNFLRRAPGLALLGRCTVLGLERKRALVKTEIVPESGDARLVCLVTANYSLP